MDANDTQTRHQQEPNMTRVLSVGLLVLAMTLAGCKGDNTPKGDIGKKDNPVAQARDTVDKYTLDKVADAREHGHHGKSDKDGPSDKKNIKEDKSKKSDELVVDPSSQDQKKNDVSRDKKSEPSKPDYSLTAESISREFLTNSEAAETKYKGKIIDVTGVVWDGWSGFVLEGAKKKESDEFWAITVRCDLLREYKKSALYLNIGQKVKVRGRYSRFLNDIGFSLSECSFSELEPSKIQKVTAESITREYVEDQKSAQKKYYGTQLIISGTVEALTKRGNFGVAMLKGEKDLPFRVNISATEELKVLRVGQFIVIRGSAIGMNDKSDELSVDGRLIESK
jgi:hypothetical protein